MNVVKGIPGMTYRNRILLKESRFWARKRGVPVPGNIQHKRQLGPWGRFMFERAYKRPPAAHRLYWRTHPEFKR